MDTPIADQVTGTMDNGNENSGFNPTRPAPTRPHRGGRNTHLQEATFQPNQDFLADLMDEQQKLISAQHSFMHDADITTLLTAQRNFIAAQNEVLDRLGVYGAKQ